MTILLPTENEAAHPDDSPARPPDATGAPSSGASYWALIDRSDGALRDFSSEALDFDIDRARALLAEHP
jgi:hypothetical protein